ncbi:MAG: TIGR04002 family protein [Clostridia bacterium]|nr:TIGR04002 family protein [Clostridia bacterium]
MKNTTKNLVLAALFAALTFVLTAYFFHVPVGVNGGYIHFGDSMIYLAASILPLPYAMAAGAIGAGLSDLMSGGAMWVVPTVIIKALMAAMFSAKQDKVLGKRNTLALIPAALICLVGYYLAESIIMGNFLVGLPSAPLTLIQSAGSSALYVLLALAFDKAKLKQKI